MDEKSVAQLKQDIDRLTAEWCGLSGKLPEDYAAFLLTGLERAGYSRDLILRTPSDILPHPVYDAQTGFLKYDYRVILDDLKAHITDPPLSIDEAKDHYFSQITTPAMRCVLDFSNRLARKTGNYAEALLERFRYLHGESAEEVRKLYAEVTHEAASDEYSQRVTAFYLSLLEFLLYAYEHSIQPKDYAQIPAALIPRNGDDINSCFRYLQSRYDSASAKYKGTAGSDPTKAMRKFLVFMHSSASEANDKAFLAANPIAARLVSHGYYAAEDLKKPRFGATFQILAQALYFDRAPEYSHISTDVINKWYPLPKRKEPKHGKQ